MQKLISYDQPQVFVDSLWVGRWNEEQTEESMDMMMVSSGLNVQIYYGYLAGYWSDGGIL